MKNAWRLNWDKIGGATSLLCAVHCVATGLLLGVLSSLGVGFVAGEAAERVLLLVAVVAGIFASVQGVRKHRKWWLPIILAAGLGTLALRHVIVPHHHHAGHAMHSEDWLGLGVSLIGATLIIGFHVWNAWLAHRPCACCGRD